MNQFRRKKVTKEILGEMKKLKETNSYKKIAETFGVHVSTVMYHLNEKTRERIKERKRKNNKIKDIDKYRKYQREYQRDRYHNDEEFREKQKKKSFNYYKKNKLKGSEK